MAGPDERGNQPVAFGNYRLERLLARGGMGEVYLASLLGELGFEKRVVVKTILPELASQARFVEMFAAEAKTAVQLSHGNIVPIYELGRHHDTFYIAMGHVDGPSVAHILERHRERGTRPGVTASLFVIREVLTGMAYAHTEEPGRAAVVHRDLSPRNVLVARSGQVRIVDFGIAMASQMRVDAKMGSSGYIAPEQARAEAADPSADVFSVGCLLYELLTLRKAFPTEGVWMVPDLSDVPEDLRAILARALAVTPKNRPHDAGAFLDELAPVLARHVASWGDKDLAAHLRELFSDGWVGADRPAAEGTTVTPTTSIATRTQTFATRLTHVAGAERMEPRRPARSRHTGRFVLGATAVVVLGLATVHVLSDGREEPEYAMNSVPMLATTRTPATDEGRSGLRATDDDGPLPGADPVPFVLRVKPTDAIVEADGKRVDGPPPYVLSVPPDGLEVLVHRKGYHEQRLAIGRGSTPPQDVELLPDGPKTPRGTARLDVRAPAVSWAQVWIDREHVGDTPLDNHEISAGAHQVRILCVADVCERDRVLDERKIMMRAGERQTIEID